MAVERARRARLLASVERVDLPARHCSEPADPAHAHGSLESRRAADDGRALGGSDRSPGAESRLHHRAREPRPPSRCVRALRHRRLARDLAAPSRWGAHAQSGQRQGRRPADHVRDDRRQGRLVQPDRGPDLLRQVAKRAPGRVPGLRQARRSGRSQAGSRRGQGGRTRGPLAPRQRRREERRIRRGAEVRVAVGDGMGLRQGGSGAPRARRRCPKDPEEDGGESAVRQEGRWIPSHGGGARLGRHPVREDARRQRRPDPRSGLRLEGRG